MKKELTLTRPKLADFNVQDVVNALKTPIEMLRKYYAHVLERDISMRQTWLLLNAQAAFLFTAFPVEAPLPARLACCAWLLDAVMRCRRAL